MAIDIFVPRVEHPPNSLRIRRGRCNSRDLSKCASRKRRLWRLLKANPDNSRARVKYRECAHEWRRLVVQQEISDEEKIISVDNLGAFYNFVNKRISNRNSITVINDSNGTVLSDSADIANAFNNYFSATGVPSNGHIPQCTTNEDIDKLTCIDALESDIIIAITKLKSNLSAGPDSLSLYSLSILKTQSLSP